ncbi:hypothetical protein BC941DRAFT_362715 [Chlamydoabsidia padenii]|nr:hypothetical protein BC941DRAFT_362715 [Chlamydoabsidia padenii]
MESQSTTTTPDELVGILLSITDIDSLRSNTQLLTSLATLTDDQLLATTLNNNNNNNNSTSDNQTRDIDPLAVLNPTLHSLGYFYFITARGKLVARHDALEYYHALYQFIQVADWNQIKLAGSQMIRMMKALDHLAQVQNDDILPLLPLYTIITRLDTLDTTTTLTVFHSALARRCILAKMYKYPLPILNKDIIQMDPKVHGTTIEHYLEYHYYGAILYIGNKEFDKALDFFTLVMTAPVQKAVSAIQLEAYKRYILVSLITYGQLCPLPKYVTPAIEKTCKKQSACYFALIDAFNNQDIGKLTSVIQRNQKTFDTNGLLGLTKQLIQASYRKKIMALTSIYYKIKLDDLAHHISPHSITPSPLTKDQIEHLLIDMVYIKKRGI